MSLYVGVDEAGRGPVLGPLVIGVVLWDEGRSWDGPRLADSKTLSPDHRVEAANHLREWTMAWTQHIPAWVIDRSRHTLPYLEALVLRDVLRHFPAASIRSDALSNGERVHNFLTDQFPDREFEFWSGADGDDPGVGAASIVAKVERDRAMETLSGRYGELGSGYPGDATTRQWLDECERGSDWPPFVRTSWSTVQRMEPGDSSMGRQGRV
jgi:ribonuclease HII